MADFSERKRLREAFLIKLYELVDGDRTQMTDVRTISAELDVDDQEEAMRAATWLADQGWAALPTMGDSIEITHFGIQEAEQRLERQLAEAEPAPAAVFLLPAEKAQLEVLIGELSRAEQDGLLDELGPDEHAEVRAHADALAAEIRSPRTPREVVKALATRVWEITKVVATLASIAGLALAIAAL